MKPSVLEIFCGSVFIFDSTSLFVTSLLRFFNVFVPHCGKLRVSRNLLILLDFPVCWHRATCSNSWLLLLFLWYLLQHLLYFISDLSWWDWSMVYWFVFSFQKAIHFMNLFLISYFRFSYFFSNFYCFLQLTLDLCCAYFSRAALLDCLFSEFPVSWCRCWLL